VVSVTPRPHFTPEEDAVPIVQEAGWAGEAENLAPTGIRSLDRPTRSQSLYQLSCPAHMACIAYEKYYENFIWLNLDPVNYYRGNKIVLRF